MALADAVCRRLMTAPGVGFVTSLTFVAAVDDPTRFKRSRTVPAHFGLTPRRFQSGDMDIPRRISRAGDPQVRATLYTAAHALMTRSSVSTRRSRYGVCSSRRDAAIDALSSPSQENSPSSSTACGSMNLHSIGVRRAAQHELIQPPNPSGVSLGGRGLDEAEYDCCALKHAQKPGSPNRPTNACSDLIYHQCRLRRGA